MLPELEKMVVCTVISGSTTPRDLTNRLGSVLGDHWNLRSKVAGEGAFLVDFPDFPSLQRARLKERVTLGSITVSFQHWTPSLRSLGPRVPGTVQLRIEGMPYHGWNTKTVEDLVQPFGSILTIHTNFFRRDDVRHIFMTLKTFSTSSIPEVKEVIILSTVVSEGSGTLVAPPAPAPAAHSPESPSLAQPQLHPQGFSGDNQGVIARSRFEFKFGFEFSSSYFWVLSSFGDERNSGGI